MDKKRCQSCGTPLSEGFYSLNEDSTVNTKYCKFCFENGHFHEPNLTLPEMIDRSIANMINDLGMPQEEAQNLANSIIPTLSRWKQK